MRHVVSGKEESPAVVISVSTVSSADDWLSDSDGSTVLAASPPATEDGALSACPALSSAVLELAPVAPAWAPSSAEDGLLCAAAPTLALGCAPSGMSLSGTASALSGDAAAPAAGDAAPVAGPLCWGWAIMVAAPGEAVAPPAADSSLLKSCASAAGLAAVAAVPPPAVALVAPPAPPMPPRMLSASTLRVSISNTVAATVAQRSVGKSRRRGRDAIAGSSVNERRGAGVGSSRTQLLIWRSSSTSCA